MITEPQTAMQRGQRSQHVLPTTSQRTWINPISQTGHLLPGSPSYAELLNAQRSRNSAGIDQSSPTFHSPRRRLFVRTPSPQPSGNPHLGRIFKPYQYGHILPGNWALWPHHPRHYPRIPGHGSVRPSDLHPGDAGFPTFVRTYIRTLAQRGTLFKTVIENHKLTTGEIEQSERALAKLLNSIPPPSTPSSCAEEYQGLQDIPKPDEDEQSEVMPPKKARGGALKKTPTRGKKTAVSTGKRVSFAAETETEAGPTGSAAGYDEDGRIEDVIRVRTSPPRKRMTDTRARNQNVAVVGPGTQGEGEATAQAGATVPVTPPRAGTTPSIPHGGSGVPNLFAAASRGGVSVGQASFAWPELDRIPVSDPDDVRLRGDSPEPGFFSFFDEAVRGDPRFCSEEERYRRAVENTLYFDPEEEVSMGTPPPGCFTRPEAGWMAQDEAGVNTETAAVAAVAAQVEQEPEPMSMPEPMPEPQTPEAPASASRRGGRGGRGSRGGRTRGGRGASATKAQGRTAKGSRQKKGQGDAAETNAMEGVEMTEASPAPPGVPGNSRADKDPAAMDVDDVDA